MEIPFYHFVQEGFIILLFISGIPLLISSAGGLIVAVLQSATQVQEQGVNFIVKFLAVCLVLWGSADLVMSRLVLFIRSMLANIAYLG